MQHNVDPQETHTSILVELISTMARSLVSKPELVKIEVSHQDGTVVLRLFADSQDIPLVIGREGRTARSLRTIVGGASMKLGERARLEIMNRIDATGEVPSEL